LHIERVTLPVSLLLQATTIMFSWLKGTITIKLRGQAFEQAEQPVHFS
jgi:hypothetical protein